MKLVVWLEEFSAQVMLESLIPRLFINNEIPSELCIEYHYFQGKSDLEKNIKRKIEKYKLPHGYKVAHLIMRDQDTGDCKKIKANLLSLVAFHAASCLLVRIACQELETFYLADLAAVGTAFNIPNLATLQQGIKYRNPDSKPNPADILDKLTKGEYQKVSGSREIGKYLDLNNSRSQSFYHVVKGIRTLFIDIGVPSECLNS